MLLPLHPETPEARLMQRVIAVLDQGGVIAYPTDSGYSLGCDARNRAAIHKLYHLKRAVKKYLMALMVRDFGAVADFARVENAAYRYMKKLVPGPYTFILPATAHGKKILDVKRPEVGVRMPNCPFGNALFRLRPEAILLTTAARVREGEDFADAADIEDALGHDVDLVADLGPAAVRPTTVISLIGGAPEVIREGQGAVP